MRNLANLGSSPYGNLNWKPMSPRTKVRVQWIRWIQLFLRIGALLGAMGMLFCVICIKGTPNTVGWIIRVAVSNVGVLGDTCADGLEQPGVALLHTVYAAYHLARSSKARTPGSSASYMIFASIMDAGLIPFYAFTAVMAHTEYSEPSDTDGRWKTLFGDDMTTYKILYATFLLSVVNGSLHVLSLVISIYLATVFRKISRLPPDMNPLEDNLTSRAHKRNKSSIVDNRMSQATTSTASSKRDSGADDPLISPPRTVPFMHTRTNSTDDILDVPHPNASPRAFRADSAGPLYDQPVSKRSSRTNFPQQSLDRPRSFYEQSQSQRTSRAQIPPSPVDSPSIYTDFSRPTSTRPPSTRPTSTRPPSAAPSIPDSNWITHPSSPSPPASPVHELRHLRSLKNSYTPLPQSAPAPAWNAENFSPLEMNPPTPLNVQRAPAMHQHPLAPGTGNSLGFGNGKLRDYEGLNNGNTAQRVVSSGRDLGDGDVDSWGRAVRMRGVSGKVVEEGRGGEWYAKSER